MIRRTCLVVSFSLLLSGVSQAQDSGDIHIRYGRVAAVEKVDVKDHTASSALFGGVLGAALLSGGVDSGSRTVDVAGSAAGGAVVGMGLEKLGQWRMKGLRYTIDLGAAEPVHVITDQTGIDKDDCVAIETGGRHANLRRVSETYCESSAEDAHLDAHARQRARACHQAKKALITAPADQLDVARRRVRALCDT